MMFNDFTTSLLQTRPRRCARCWSRISVALRAIALRKCVRGGLAPVVVAPIEAVRSCQAREGLGQWIPNLSTRALRRRLARLVGDGPR